MAAEAGAAPAPVDLRAALEEKLQAHANAEKWPVGPDVRKNRLHQPAAADRSNRISEGTNSRQHEMTRFGHDVWVVGDVGLDAHPLERLLHAAEVAAAVVDDRDHGRSLGPRAGDRKWPPTSHTARLAQAAGGGESLRLEARIRQLASASTDPRLLERRGKPVDEAERCHLFSRLVAAADPLRIDHEFHAAVAGAATVTRPLRFHGRGLKTATRVPLPCTAAASAARFSASAGWIRSRVFSM